MKTAALLLLIPAFALLAQCPLGFTPDQACSADSPSCALFVDGNGDFLCDNPGPQPGASEEQVPDDSTSSSSSDSTVTSAEEEDDSDIPSPDTSAVEEPVEVHEEPVQTSAFPEPAEETFETLRYPRIDSADSAELAEAVLILADDQGHLFCAKPETSTVAGHTCVSWEIGQRLTDSSTITGEVQIQLGSDSVYVDTVTVEEVTVSAPSCPLGYSPEEACPVSDPSCTLYSDSNSDDLCDNPGLPDATSSSVNVSVTGRAYGLVKVGSGCPLNLPPEAACPSPEQALCPHYGRFSEGCSNPSGGGMDRTLIVLIAIAVLLPLSTMARRCCRGRRKEDRKKRKKVHIIFHAVSLVVLGFIVQGCFCPLGAAQYALLPGGLVFLGLLGIAVLILPMIWSLFFDRVFCGWVCPMGALQDLLGKLHVPRPPMFSRKVHHVLSGLKYLFGVLFVGFLILAGSGQFPGLAPEAFFCRFDPFHTVFSFFILGSFTFAVAFMGILVFFPRFFCKYLCFYGAILSFLGRVGLWKRMTRKHPREESLEETRKE